MFDTDSPVRRLYPDYRAIETDYASRVGFYPSHHIFGIRSSAVEEHPWLVRSLFDAFEESRKQSEVRCQMMLDTVPWLQEELEQIQRILGPNWQAHGVEPNQKMIATFARELHEQGIIATPVEPARIFAGFEEIMAAD
jgi:4,5-dihydroxyphthalate decarboxylase